MEEKNQASNNSDEDEQPVQETKEQIEARWVARKAELFDTKIKADVLPFSQYEGEYRAPHAWNSGGFELKDDVLLGKHRSVVTEMLQSAGRKLINGEFNLTRISFPIRCMSSNTTLQQSSLSFSTMPLYYNLASKLGADPLERLKMIISADVSSVIYTETFEKPLNPVLGETYNAHGQDGAKFYMEQISHHPPIMAVLIEHENYTFSCSTEWAIRAGLQSAEVEYVGSKKVSFEDGGEIIFSSASDKYCGLFMGTFGHQQLGRANYRDEKNGLTAFVEFNGYIFKKQDFVWGEIHKDGKKVCDILGNYVGFLDFDGVRYWDFREGDAVHFPIEPSYDHLESDARNRTDGIYLMTKTVEEAQAEKERLENIQRNDKTLREACAARREAGGPKFAPRKTDNDDDE